MNYLTILCVLLLTVFAAAKERSGNLTLAEECDEATCRLPNCRCSSTSIPGGLSPRDTPQFILLTFDDNVNIINIETYRSLYWRRNRNGCLAGISFYVNHEYTNYVFVNELYNHGYEIALHSMTRSTPVSYWAEASYETMMLEFGDQRTQMAHFANIPRHEIHGVRIPFLQMAGNASFQMMQSASLTYDISWPTTTFVNPALWPYTLDYASKQDCLIPPCPTASLPGPWVIPLITWTDLGNFPCSYVDSCIFTPALDDEDGWFRFIMRNFERHYGGNRAPFGFHVREGFIATNPAVRRAMNRFLDVVNNLHDTFMVNAKDVIDWVRNPVTVDVYARQPCRFRFVAPCIPRHCGPLSAEHTQVSYWLQACTQCPSVYPWLGNPLGLQRNSTV